MFLSVGGYHHHLGMNTWESLGAGGKTGSLGLKTFTLELPDEDWVQQLKERLIQHTIQVQEIKSGIECNDPWNNRIIVKKS